MGLKGKTGESPARSRHCEGDLPYEVPLGQLLNGGPGKAWGGDEPEPGNLPVRRTPLIYAR